MKIAKRVLLSVLGIYLIALAAGFLLPKETIVSRNIVVDAPQALVFELVSNHKDFARWSPWAKKDPSMKVELSGPEKGVGSKQSWSSKHPQVGTGESVYTEYEPYTRARTQMTFDQGGGDAVFNVKALSDNQTEVEWLFETAHSNIFERYIGYFLIDNMIGGEYEVGLNDLKTLAESLPAVVTEEVEYEHEGTKLTGFLAKPMGKEDAPIVLVVHEWWGHNAYARKRAAMLAELGYNAFALDMYGDGKLATHPKDAQAFMMEVVQNTDVLVGRFDAATDFLTSRAEFEDTDIAAIGYCFGGAVVLSMARSGKDLEGVVSFHGALGGLAPIAEGASVPALVLNGADDPFITEEQIITFKNEMDEADIPYTFINYEGAKHSFTSEKSTEVGKQFELPLEYNAAADEASWAEMQTFLASVFE